MIKPMKLPFEGTNVDPERTKGEIISLLKKFGISDYAWKEEMGQAQLMFKTDILIDEQQKILTIILNPPILAREKRIYDEAERRLVKKMIPLYSQSYRIMLNYLKAKLTNIALGVVKFEDEFLADIAVPTEHGPRRLVDIVKSKGLLSLPEIPRNWPESSERK
jgi:hypothetical protein